MANVPGGPVLPDAPMAPNPPLTRHLTKCHCHFLGTRTSQLLHSAPGPPPLPPLNAGDPGAPCLACSSPLHRSPEIGSVLHGRQPNPAIRPWESKSRLPPRFPHVIALPPTHLTIPPLLVCTHCSLCSSIRKLGCHIWTSAWESSMFPPNEMPFPSSPVPSMCCFHVSHLTMAGWLPYLQ